jgi:dihydroneopterin aldolase
MSVTSHLLENVAKRVLDSLYSQSESIIKAEIKISKMNPPMGGEIEKVSVTMSR